MTLSKVIQGFNDILSNKVKMDDDDNDIDDSNTSGHKIKS